MPLMRTHCAWLVADLADAIAHAHDREILHRDVKPANILISASEGPQLLDFNLAHDPHAADRAETALRGGTLPYMAPEQLGGLSGSGTLGGGRTDGRSLRPWARSSRIADRQSTGGSARAIYLCRGRSMSCFWPDRAAGHACTWRIRRYHTRWMRLSSAVPARNPRNAMSRGPRLRKICVRISDGGRWYMRPISIGANDFATGGFAIACGRPSRCAHCRNCRLVPGHPRDCRGWEDVPRSGEDAPESGRESS